MNKEQIEFKNLALNVCLIQLKELLKTKKINKEDFNEKSNYIENKLKTLK